MNRKHLKTQALSVPLDSEIVANGMNEIHSLCAHERPMDLHFEQRLHAIYYKWLCVTATRIVFPWTGRQHFNEDLKRTRSGKRMCIHFQFCNYVETLEDSLATSLWQVLVSTVDTRRSDVCCFFQSVWSLLESLSVMTEGEKEETYWNIMSFAFTRWLLPVGH